MAHPMGFNPFCQIRIPCAQEFAAIAEQIRAALKEETANLWTHVREACALTKGLVARDGWGCLVLQ